MTIATPETLTDVGLPWMSQVLGVELDRIDVEQIGAGHGFMGQLGRVDAALTRPDVSDVGDREVADR